jgi:hypothetical protein
MSSYERETAGGPRDLVSLIEELIAEVAKELRSATREKPLHTLVTDLLKLVEAQKEVAPSEVREVTVRWIEQSRDERCGD